MNCVIRINTEILTRLLEEARRLSDQECCGLLAGTAGVITHILPATNALASPTAYEIAPRELFELFREMRAHGLQHLGIYHSHPNTENVPSPRDIAQAFYPDVAYFILSPLPSAPQPIRAFAIYGGAAAELGVAQA
jgi:[CysO sulfur-carrier protein]-S-L-cysteine hydrolase